MTLGEQIKEAREKKGYSQEELAEMCDVSRQAVSKWENDISVPQGANRETLGEILEVEYLQEGKDSSAEEREEKPAFAGIKRKYFALGIFAAFLSVCIISIGFFIITKPERQNQDRTQDGMSQDGENRDQAPGGMPQDGQSAVQNPAPGEAESVGGEKDNVQPKVTYVGFYNGEEEEVLKEAGWYNAAYMESILIQWEGDVPVSISIHYVPSGSDTLGMSEILSTKTILDFGTATLLNPQILKDKNVSGHVTFQLNYEAYTINSEMYNIFYDPELPPAEE